MLTTESSLVDELATPAAVYRRADTAEAEGAVPGWTMPVDDLFQARLLL